MTSLRFPLCVFVIVVLLSMISASMLQAADSDPDKNWDLATPSEIHQELGKRKAEAYLAREQALRFSAADLEDNTQTNYDVKFYDVAIRVNDTTEVIYGRVRMVAVTTEGGVGEVQVDFYSGMTIDSIATPSGLLGYTRNGDMVTVALGYIHSASESFEFEIFYHGHPTESGLQGFSFDTRSHGKVITTLSEPYNARSWWPCKDRMDDKPDSMDIAITVDTLFYVGSNGTLDSTINHGDNSHTFYYRVRYPIVTYLFSLAISNYTVWTDEWIYNDGLDTMPLVHAVYPDWYDYSLTHFDITPYALTVFSDKYGLYPFADEKYGHANFEWGGAMEHQTMTSAGGNSFGFSEPVVVHEMSHQWWGDMITCRSWEHIWLNEGWASYSEALYYLEKDGWTTYHSYMNDMAYSGGGTIWVDDTTDVWRIFHGGLSYNKGAWVVHMLRGVLGDSLFYEGIQAYYGSIYQYGAATTEDFRDVIEAATGVELDWFFEEWIYGTYLPNYEWAYYQEPSDSGGYDVWLIVEQQQTSPPTTFTMPVDFFINYSSEPDDTLTLMVDERKDLFALNLPGNVYQMECDPSDWVLKYENEVSWDMRLVSWEVPDGEQYSPYVDTLVTKGGDGSYGYMVSSGALPDGYILSTDGIISGLAIDTGRFEFDVFVTDNYTRYNDWREMTIYIAPSDGMPGDINVDGFVNVADLTYLVQYLFAEGPAPLVQNLADVNASCRINIADLTYLVAYLFSDGEAPQMGCVS